MRQSEGPRFWKGASPGLMVPVLRPFGDPAHWRPGAFIHRVAFEVVCGHQVLIKSGPGKVDF